jgi:hypothetical protein
MKRCEYFRMKLELFPQDIIDEYNLTSKVDHNGNVHCKIQQGMYGQSQAGIIAQELLKTMGNPKQASLHRNFLKHNSRWQATCRANYHWATGSRNGDPSASY